jgi:repressor of nif and glnA expression
LPLVGNYSTVIGKPAIAAAGNSPYARQLHGLSRGFDGISADRGKPSLPLGRNSFSREGSAEDMTTGTPEPPEVSEKRRRKQAAILRVLRDATRPLSGREVTQELLAEGDDVSERTVRLYLKELDDAGLTRNVGRRGREITDRGRSELLASHTLERVGFLSAKIDRMTYRMDFDLVSRSGTVVINLTIAKPKDIAKCLPRICRVFSQGYTMGDLALIVGPGERIGEVTIPRDAVGFGTVCSITVNGVFLKYGIPTHSRFGGLLELRDRRPTRFVEIINYDGTSIDPLEVFIRSGMTDYHGAIQSGNGRVGASFREVPSDCLDLVGDLARRLQSVGLGGIMSIGRPGQTLLGIPVDHGRAGIIVIGGLNPTAILEESGIRAESRALASLIDFKRLVRYDQLADALKDCA